MNSANLTDTRQRWKQAMQEHYRDMGFSHALTLSWNNATPLPAAREHLRLLHAKVDRMRLGPRFHKKPRAERSQAVFVFEGIGSFLHVHSLWRVRLVDMLSFNHLFPGNRGGVWNRIVESGSYDLDLVDDALVCAGYALKGQHPWSDDREVLWSDEFVRD